MIVLTTVHSLCLAPILNCELAPESLHSQENLIFLYHPKGRHEA
jgi:hypothetical protein